VAEYLRVKPQTIYTWAQENKIPAAKIGREWRFRKTVIDKWFNDQMNEKFRNY
jgi:excisionase family DNA binding protein